MIEAIVIAAFAICAACFEASVTRIHQGPPTDEEFAAAVQFERESMNISEQETLNQ